MTSLMFLPLWWIYWNLFYWYCLLFLQIFWLDDIVIDDKTCEERLWKMKHRGETNFYLCEINRDMVIDATHKGNKSRYINHSCCPNTQMQKWFVSCHHHCLCMFEKSHNLVVLLLAIRIIDGETRIGIFATCDIKKGEHLTYDYQ